MWCHDSLYAWCNDVTSVHNNDNDIAQLDIRPQTKDKTAINQDINNPLKKETYFLFWKQKSNANNVNFILEPKEYNF